MERVLGFFIGLVLICNLVVVTIHVLDQNTSLIRDKTPPAGSSSTVSVVPAPGQAFITGEADHVSIDNAQGQPIPSPFTVTAVERGVGRLTIEQALVGGRRSTIVWDGGTPLPVSGEGSLDFGATHVEIDGAGPVYSLDGGAKKLSPGTYSLGTTVAVGTGGLSTPREGVTFTADDQTTVGARGGVVIRLDPAPLEFNGPGKLLVTGKLTVQFRDRRATGSKAAMDEGPFRLSTQPAPGGLKVDAIAQGPVAVS